MLGSYLESEGRLSKENINQRVAMISGYYFPNLKILIFNNFLIILFCKKKGTSNCLIACSNSPLFIEGKIEL